MNWKHAFPLLALGALHAQPPQRVEFAFRLLEAAAPNGNACLSPWSAATALAMARAGAAGETAEEMDAALGLDGQQGWRELARRKITPGAASEDGERPGPAYQLVVANAAWARPDQAFLDGYLEVLEQDFRAPLRRADLGSDSGRAAINAWVADQTKQRIRSLLEPGMPPKDSRLILVNCVYLDAAWETPFPQKATAPAPFHLDDGATADVQTMRRKGGMAYLAGEHAHFVELPYRGGDLVMLLAVPKEVGAVAAAQAELAAGWPLQGLAERTVELYLPRFELQLAYSLRQALERLGMQTAFDKERADFSAMTSGRDLYVAAVVQKTFVKADEKRTEAAAATGVVLAPTAAAVEPEEPTVVRADHPFLFVIHHRPTGAILFVGRVCDPR